MVVISQIFSQLIWSCSVYGFTEGTLQFFSGRRHDCAIGFEILCSHCTVVTL